VYCGENAGAVLGGGGDVAADGVPVAGGLLRAEPAGDLLLGFRRPQITFGLGGGRRYLQVGKEAQDVVPAVAQAFQQQPAGRLLFVAAGARRTWDRPTATPWRTRRSSAAVASSGTAARPCPRARFAAWMRARSASAICPGQTASG
jgi:hypothetical protein